MTIKALSVRQPYAWALVNGHKPVENRTQAWSHRGLLAIQAPIKAHALGLEDPAVHAAWAEQYGDTFLDSIGTLPLGAVVGVVNLVGAHVHDDCCQPWGSQAPRVKHLQVADAIALDPIPCKGKRGLFDLPERVEAAVQAALSARR